MSDNDETVAAPIPAAEWRALRLALSERLASLKAARDAATDIVEASQLQRRIDDLRAQIRTLAVEESVAQFVEDSERYVITSGTLAEELGRDPDAEPA